MATVCPITRNEIEPCDLFEFRTSSGKIISYSANSLFDWIDHSSKMSCPLTREQFDHLDLMRLQTTTNKQFSFLKSFMTHWKKILNFAYRKEAQIVFDKYRFVWEDEKREDFQLLSHMIGVLICMSTIAGRPSYRAFSKKNRGSTMNKIIGIVDIVSLFVDVDIRYCERNAKVRYYPNVDNAIDNAHELVASMVINLPRYDISITRNMVKYTRNMFD